MPRSHLLGYSALIPNTLKNHLSLKVNELRGASVEHRLRRESGVCRGVEDQGVLKGEKQA
jgi:hypothetical protein